MNFPALSKRGPILEARAEGEREFGKGLSPSRDLAQVSRRMREKKKAAKDAGSHGDLRGAVFLV